MRQTPKPWDAIGVSRATWYRHGKPTQKPTRVTQEQMAKAFGVSVRTIQRDRALAIKRTLDKMRKAKAEGRELNVQEFFFRPNLPPSATSARGRL